MVCRDASRLPGSNPQFPHDLVGAGRGPSGWVAFSRVSGEGAEVLLGVPPTFKLRSVTPPVFITGGEPTVRQGRHCRAVVDDLEIGTGRVRLIDPVSFTI
jgi:hypothetical protein